MLRRLIQPALPDYDGFEWEKLPFEERARLVCHAWCMQGYGTPALIHLAYVLKVLGFVGLWFFFCGFTPGLGSLADLGAWYAHPVAFQKAILLLTLIEGLGIAGSSGPLTGRYLPPFGGFLYFLRPGTTKLSRLGGTRRTILDAGLYAGVIATLLFGLVSASIPHEVFLALAVMIPVLGVLDRTVFLALRAEHYWPTILCFAFMPNWIAGAKAVQLAIWFWAGVSKLNHHFPTVVAVMLSNHPFMRSRRIRSWLYKSFPQDVRPSRLAVFLAHSGALLEFGVPLTLAFATGGVPLVIGMILMLQLHAFIFSNIPMAVPLEWNVMAVYGGFALFWAHPDVSFWQMDNLWVAAVLFGTLVVTPLVGNLFPERVSFLLSMRYYAGNWPYTVWLFRGDSYRKLAKIKGTSPWVDDQLAPFYEASDIKAIVGKVMGFRLMHLQGRVLANLLPRAVERLEDYAYMDGEIIAGLVLGWNFGDGHLHNEGLLAAVQEQCGFEPGELRCIMVEAQPIHRQEMDWRIVDAATGELERGTAQIAEMRTRQPWQCAIAAERA